MVEGGLQGRHGFEFQLSRVVKSGYRPRDVLSSH